MPLGAAQKAKIDETVRSEVSKQSGENFHSTGFAYQSARCGERARLIAALRAPFSFCQAPAASVLRKKINSSTPKIRTLFLPHLVLAFAMNLPSGFEPWTLAWLADSR